LGSSTALLQVFATQSEFDESSLLPDLEVVIGGPGPLQRSHVVVFLIALASTSAFQLHQHIESLMYGLPEMGKLAS